jgi:hypothetical protein
MKKTPFQKRYFLLLIGCLIVIGHTTKAQPFSLGDKIKPIELPLTDFKAKDSVFNGKAFYGTTIQRIDTAYYFVKGLNIFQPVYFKLYTNDNKNIIKVFLAKESWKQADKFGTTDKNGIWHIPFRTEGSFGIMVVTPRKNIEYAITVWAQKEPKRIKMPSPFKSKKSTK